MLGKQREAAERYDLQKNEINNQPQTGCFKDYVCPLSLLWGKMFAKTERKDVRRTNTSSWGGANGKIIRGNGNEERIKFL